MVTRASSGVVSLVALTLVAVGCQSILGIEDHPLAPQGSGGLDGGSQSGAGAAESAGRPGNSGNSGAGGMKDEPLTAGSAGAGPAGAGPIGEGGAGGAENPTPAPCTEDDLRCSGNQPQKCMNGDWSKLPACGGAVPVCSHGVCNSYLVTGGLRAEFTSDGAGIFRVRSAGFELGDRVCGKQGLCATGGIVP